MMKTNLIYKVKYLFSVSYLLLGIVLSLSSCGGDNDDPSPTPTPPKEKAVASIAKATVVQQPEKQRVYKDTEKIVITLQTNESNGFGKVELDIYINGKLYKDNYQTDTNKDKKLTFTINPLDLGDKGVDIKNIVYKITDHKTTKEFKQTRIHNNIVETITVNETF